MFTNAQVATLIASLRAEFRAATPVATGTTAKVAAKSPAFGDKTFSEYVESRNAAKLACALHPAESCNRRFSPASSGNASHVAKLV